MITQGTARKFIALNVVNGIGDGLLVPTQVLFFVRVAGLSGGSVALGLSLAGVVAAVALTPSAGLAERAGLKTAMVGLYVFQGASVAAFLLVKSWWSFAVLVAVTAAASATVLAVRQALISQYAGPEDRVRVSAANRVAYNASLAVGALAAGGAVAVGSDTAYRLLIVGDAISFLAVAVVSATLPAVAVKRAVARIRWTILGENRALTLVAALVGVMYLYTDVIAVGLPLLVVTDTSLPKWTVPGAFMLNTVMTVGLQLRLSQGVNDVSRAAAVGARAGLMLLAGTAILGLATWTGSWSTLLVVGVAVAVLTLGELWTAAATWGLSFGLSTAARADQIGLFSLGGLLVRTIGPALVGAVVLHLHYAGWLLLGVVMAVAALALTPAAARAKQRIPA